MTRNEGIVQSSSEPPPPSSERLPRRERPRFGAASRIVSAVLAVGAIGAGALLPASCQTGGIGDPCTPEDEYRGQFAGFQLTQENIESRSFQCESRICLVNFFQGRVSCPAGQSSKTACGGDGDCSGDEKCVESTVISEPCTEDSECNGTPCNAAGYCECTGDDSCPEGFVCDTSEEKGNKCVLKVCHAPGNCQDPTQSMEDNVGKDCCIPGTDTPVQSEVCGQCDAEGLRNAENSVYCSCRCGVAEGAPEDDNFNFCECPDGFTCAEVRAYFDLGDQQLTGKYCVKADDPIISNGKVEVAKATQECGTVVGHKGDECLGQKGTVE